MSVSARSAEACEAMLSLISDRGQRHRHPGRQARNRSSTNSRQVDSSSTRRHEGTGLGLAITAGLVDLFGGYDQRRERTPARARSSTVNLPLQAIA
ncbi:hypothetical protein [Rhizobium yanglingense]